MDEFIHFEKERHLFSRRINNVPIWALIRFRVFTKTRDRFFPQKVSNVNNSVTGGAFLSRIKGFFKFLFYKNPLIFMPKTDVLCFNHSRRKINAKSKSFEDIYFDPWLPSLKERYVVIQRLYNKNKLFRAKTKNLFYLDAVEFLRNLLSYFFLTNVAKKENEGVSELVNIIHKTWGVDPQYLSKEIIETLAYYKFMFPVLSFLIKKASPKKIIVVGSYSQQTTIVTHIARKEQIPVIEVQHGTVGRYHIGYNYSNNEEVETFPTHFFAWGKHWVKHARLPLHKNNMKIVGFPYVDAFKPTSRPKESQIITVISQKNDRIAKFAEQLANKLPDFRIFFKAHPAEYRDAAVKYSYLSNIPNIEVVSDDHTHLYDLLAESDFVLGVSSTVLIEALAFNNIIIILKEPTWEYFEDLIDNLQVYSISNIDEALKLVRQCGNNNSSNKAMNNFFETNAQEKFLHALNGIKH